MKIFKEDFAGYKFIEGITFKNRLVFNSLYDTPPIVYANLGKNDFMDIGGRVHFKNEIEYIELSTARLKVLWFINNFYRK